MSDGEPSKQTLAEVNRFLRKLLLVLPRKEGASATCFPWIRGNGCHRNQLDSMASSSLSSAISPASLSFLTSSSPFKLPPYSPANSSPRERFNSLQSTHVNSRVGEQSIDSGESFGTHEDMFARQQQQQQQQTQEAEVPTEQVNSGTSTGTEEDTSRSDEMSSIGNEEKSRIDLMPLSSDAESLATAASTHNSFSNSNDHAFPLDVSRNLFQSRIQLTDREPRVYPRVYHSNSRLSLLAGNRLKNASTSNSANTVTQSSGKRGFDCIRKCITEAGLHPVQCHSIC